MYSYEASHELVALVLLRGTRSTWIGVSWRMRTDSVAGALPIVPELQRSYQEA